MSTNPGVRILFVEDNEEIREALSTVLEGEGYAVDAVGSAEEGLSRLRGRTYELLLTDYSLPGETGAWMVARAREEAVLGGAVVLMVTAHPDPSGTEGLRVIRKPLDLAEFLREVAEVTAPAHMGETQPARGILALGATP
ncbi:MAG: response regulator [Myxococcaceae bacterium]|nr:response regulator [Myxococcaceae bacterium]MCI0669662.1 response regulator [Myxococcaceae bacterium]